MGVNVKSWLKPIPVIAFLTLLGMGFVDWWLSTQPMPDRAHWVHHGFIAFLSLGFVIAIWKISRTCDARHPHENFQCILTKGHQGCHTGIYIRTEKVEWWTDDGQR